MVYAPGDDLVYNWTAPDLMWFLIGTLVPQMGVVLNYFPFCIPLLV